MTGDARDASAGEPAAAAVSRQLMHTRKTTFNGYLRSDGLWDIEAELVDTKPYTISLHERTHVPAGEPIHAMTLRVTLDEAMTVVDIAPAMTFVPFGMCPQVLEPMRAVIGLAIGPGWRRSVERLIGKEQGCAHLRELLFALATAAYQTISPYRSHLRRMEGRPAPQTAGQPSFQMGQCMSWGFGSPVMARYEPMFYRPPPPSGE
jgi:hypothetical protein